MKFLLSSCFSNVYLPFVCVCLSRMFKNGLSVEKKSIQKSYSFRNVRHCQRGVRDGGIRTCTVLLNLFSLTEHFVWKNGSNNPQNITDPIIRFFCSKFFLSDRWIHNLKKNGLKSSLTVLQGFLYMITTSDHHFFLVSSLPLFRSRN